MLFRRPVRVLSRPISVRPAIRRVIETLLISGLMLFINVATGVISARALGPSGRGELTSITLFLTVTTYCLTFGLPTSVIYTLKRQPNESPRIVGAAFIISFLLGSLATLLGILLIPFWLDYPHHNVRAAQILMGFSPLSMLAIVCSAVVQAKEQFYILNGIRFMVPFVTLIGLSAIDTVGIMTPLTAALAYILPVFIAIGWPLYWIKNNCRPQFNEISKFCSEVLQYGVRSFIIDLASTFYKYLDQLILIAWLSPASVGLYVVARSMAQPLYEFGVAVILVLFPKASGYTRQRAIDITGLAARVNLPIMVVAGLALEVIAPLLLGGLFGPAFLPAVQPFRFLVIAVILTVTADTLAQAFMATGKPGTVSALRGAELAVLITSLIILARRNGIEGAAVAILVSATFRLAAMYICFPLILSQKGPRMYLNASDVRQLVSRDVGS